VAAVPIASQTKIIIKKSGTTFQERLWLKKCFANDDDELEIIWKQAVMA
jgi:hypothetical protein